jgi:hypothetical protein
LLAPSEHCLEVWLWGRAIFDPFRESALSKTSWFKRPDTFPALDVRLEAERGRPVHCAAGQLLDPFETSSRLAFLGSFVNIVRMTVVVITFANLWWRST